MQKKDIEFFRNLYLTFLEYDGNLLKRELFSCNKTFKISPVQQQLNAIDEDDPCYDFRRARIVQRRTHLYYVDYNYEPVSIHHGASYSIIRQHYLGYWAQGLERRSWIRNLQCHVEDPVG